MTKDDIIQIYEKANGWSPAGFEKTVSELIRFADELVEQCALIADEAEPYKAADLIRKRMKS